MSGAETLYLLAEFGPQGIDTHTNTSGFAIPGLVWGRLRRNLVGRGLSPCRSANRARALLDTSLILIQAIDRGIARPLQCAMSPGRAAHG